MNRYDPHCFPRTHHFPTVINRENLRSAWLATGWLGIAIVTWYTLVPDPPQIDVEQGDKIQHLIAYAALMWWFAQVRTVSSQRRVTALMFVLMGCGLELAQGLTGYRYMSGADMLANAAGVVAGWAGSPPRLPSVHRWIEGLFVRRSNGDTR